MRARHSTTTDTASSGSWPPWAPSPSTSSPSDRLARVGHACPRRLSGVPTLWRIGPGAAGGVGVNVISLPSMTGLILAGLDPLTAIPYQIVVLHMLLAATTLSALVAARAM